MGVGRQPTSALRLANRRGSIKAMTIELTKDTFQEFVNSADTPVVVDFWAPWCGPCKQIAPVIDELSEQMVSDVKFAKVNIEEFPEFGPLYEIRSIPALLVFKDGELVNRVSIAGGFSKTRVEENVRIAIAG